MKVIAIIQARMGSKRLPGKVMKKINGIPLIEYLLLRLSRAKTLDSIIVATSDQAENLPLVNFLETKGYNVTSGSEMNVLERYFTAAKNSEANAIVRITADCPLIDPQIVDDIVKNFKKTNQIILAMLTQELFQTGLMWKFFQ